MFILEGELDHGSKDICMSMPLYRRMGEQERRKTGCKNKNRFFNTIATVGLIETSV